MLETNEMPCKYFTLHTRQQQQLFKKLALKRKSVHTYIHTCIYGPTSNLRREDCNAPHHPPLQWNGLTKKLLLLIWGEWWLLSSSWRWWCGVAWRDLTTIIENLQNGKNIAKILNATTTKLNPLPPPSPHPTPTL